VGTRKKIARNLLAKGFDPAIVAETTDISADELAAISF
jgi:SOS response regulatory protein OraA/RecX